MRSEFSPPFSMYFLSESQRKKQNNQEDSDEEDDDDEPGPSFQHAAAAQPQPTYAAPMAQPGMPPVAGAPGMPPGGYQGKASFISITGPDRACLLFTSLHSCQNKVSVCCS